MNDDEEMMSSSDDVPSTIVCHFFEQLEHAENDEDVMMDVLDFSTSTRSAFNNSRHLIDDISGATGARSDNVSDEELCAMKDMVASMRRNPELLNQSPVMQRACLTSSSLGRFTLDKASPDETIDVKNEDLCAMKAMIASMRKDPRLLYKSPVMQKACLTITNSIAAGPNLVSPHEDTPLSTRRPLGTKFDPTKFPSLPLSSVARSVSIDKNAVKAPSSPASSSPASMTEMDKKEILPKRSRSV